MPRYRRTGAGDSAEDERARYLRAVRGGCRPQQARLRTSLRRTGLRRTDARHGLTAQNGTPPGRSRSTKDQAIPVGGPDQERPRPATAVPAARTWPAGRPSSAGVRLGFRTREFVEARVKVRPSPAGWGACPCRTCGCVRRCDLGRSAGCEGRLPGRRGPRPGRSGFRSGRTSRCSRRSPCVRRRSRRPRRSAGRPRSCSDRLPGGRPTASPSAAPCRNARASSPSPTRSSATTARRARPSSGSHSANAPRCWWTRRNGSARRSHTDRRPTLSLPAVPPRNSRARNRPGTAVILPLATPQASTYSFLYVKEG